MFGLVNLQSTGALVIPSVSHCVCVQYPYDHLIAAAVKALPFILAAVRLPPCPTCAMEMSYLHPDSRPAHLRDSHRYRQQDQPCLRVQGSRLWWSQSGRGTSLRRQADARQALGLPGPLLRRVSVGGQRIYQGVIYLLGVPDQPAMAPGWGSGGVTTTQYRER